MSVSDVMFISNLILCVIVFLLFLITFFTYWKKKYNLTFSVIICFLSFFVFYYLFAIQQAISPTGDYLVYRKEFYFITEKVRWENIVSFLVDQKDPIFYFFVFLISRIGNFFVFTTVIFVAINGLYFCALKKLLGYYYLYGIVLYLCSLYFVSFNINVLRFGIASSFFIYGFSCLNDKKTFSWIWFLLAFGIHFSFLLLICSFILSKFFTFRQVLFIWFICLFLAICGFDLSNIFASSLDRASSYSTCANINRYKAGFRFDFVIYSLFFPLLSVYISRKRNILLDKILKVYLISNTFFLFVIRMPFSDRVAGLSWMFIPFILVLPLIDKNNYPIPFRYLFCVVLMNFVIVLIIG